MNIFRQMTAASNASGPPSPTSTASSSNNASNNNGTDDHDESDEFDIVEAELSRLKSMFTDEVYGHICRTKRSSGNPLANSAMRYVIEKSRSLGDYASPEDLLRHYGIRVQQEPSRRQRIGTWLLRILPSLITTTRKAEVDDPTKTMMTFATIFFMENPDGGLGYSFGTLLQRYIIQHFVLAYSHFQGIQYNIVGGKGNPYIPNGTHVSCVHGMKRPDVQADVDIKLHQVRAKHVAQSGAGSLLGRVKIDLGDLVEKQDDIVYLCHGTTLESGSSIVLNGVDVNAGAKSADFGEGFYTTDSWEYAVLAAHQAKANSAHRMDCVVLVFPVPRGVLEGCQLLDLTNNRGRWNSGTKRGIRGLKIRDESLRKEYNNAHCIVGPTVKNFDRVHSAREEPRQSEYIQWAFTKEEFADDILNRIIERGELHFVRFYHESEGDWDSTTGERETRHCIANKNNYTHVDAWTPRSTWTPRSWSARQP